MLRRKKIGQSTAEYAIVIGLVIAAAVAMQVYVKRGIQAKVKGAVDYKPGAMFTTNQYEPFDSTSDMNATRTSQVVSETTEGGIVERRMGVAGADGGQAEVSSRTGRQTTRGLDASGQLKTTD
jgi:hypothetical protein